MSFSSAAMAPMMIMRGAVTFMISCAITCMMMTYVCAITMVISAVSVMFMDESGNAVCSAISMMMAMVTMMV